MLTWWGAQALNRTLLCASFAPHALKGQKLLAQGSALGNYGRPPCRPVRAKALKLMIVAFLRTTVQRYANFPIPPNFSV